MPANIGENALTSLWLLKQHWVPRAYALAQDDNLRHVRGWKRGIAELEIGAPSLLYNRKIPQCFRTN